MVRKLSTMHDLHGEGPPEEDEEKIERLQEEVNEQYKK